MSLLKALDFRYPIVWVNTQESERFIFGLSSIVENRDIYVFDAFDGLTIWNKDKLDFKIVTVERSDDEGNIVDVPIIDPGAAFGYCINQGHRAIFIIRNFHKGVDDYLNILASHYSKYYRGFRFDNMEEIPMTVLCLAPNNDIPVEISSFTTVESFDTPDESALVELLSYLSEKIPQPSENEFAIEDEHIVSLAKACRGMSEQEVITTTFDLVKTKGKVLADDIERLKYERLKASSSLNIVKPAHGLEAVGGLDIAKDIVRKADWIRRNPEVAKQRKLQPINKILLLGVPGAGKSFFCEAASKTLGLDLAKTGVSQAMNKFIGESERNIREIFRQINILAPIAVWIDELGRDFQGGDFDGGTTNRVHGEMLTALNELPDNVALFAAANDISSLPPEMLRSGRFDKILFVGYPAFNERIEILKIHLSDNETEHNWEGLANVTTCMTGAEIVEGIKQARFNNIYVDGPITDQDLIRSFRGNKNTLWNRHRQHVQRMYREAIEMHEWASSEQQAEAPSIISGNFNSNNTNRSGMKIKS